MKHVRHPFRRLREEKLFQVETEYSKGRGPTPASPRKAWRRVEHFWLCDACSPFVTLTFDGERGVITVSLPDGAGKKTVRGISLDGTAPVASTGEPIEAIAHEVPR